MKHCNRCDITKSLDEFGNNKRKEDGKQAYCKECAKAYNAAHYRKHPDRRRAWNLKSLKLAQQFVWNYLLVHPCSDCPEADPVVLQFDHVRGTKLFNISEAVHAGYSIRKIQEEIDKCEVRCANCHLRQTASRGNWYKHIDI